MTRKPFRRPNRLEEVYRREIDRLLDKYFHLPTFDTLGELNARLVEFAQGQNFLQGFALNLAKRMVTQVAASNAVSWRAAATQSSQGREIYRILRNETDGTTVGKRIDELVALNAELIRSVPQNAAGTLVRYIQAQQMAGVRSDQIVKVIGPKFAELKRYQVKRLARTEVAKADTAITRARAENIGLNWYQWETSEDARVRISHKKMDRVLINWDDPPSPELLVGEKSEGHYNAGNIYNCRCVCLPLISLEEITFPAQVYIRGSIRRLTRNQFALLSGVQRQIAA